MLRRSNSRNGAFSRYECTHKSFYGSFAAILQSYCHRYHRFLLLLRCIYVIIIHICFLRFLRQRKIPVHFRPFKPLFTYNKCETAYIVHLIIHKIQCPFRKRPNSFSKTYRSFLKRTCCFSHRT